MKIVSCFSSPDELKPLAAAGADEVYCAVPELPSFGEPAAIGGLRALGAAVRQCRTLGLKLSLAVNSQEEADFTLAGARRLQRAVRRADEMGVASFIVANPGLLRLLGEVRPLRAALHLSSVQPCFNSLTAGLFIRQGVSRIIFPNQLSPHEARGILELCRKRRVETEIFDYRFFGCAYVNGRCRFHRPDYYSLRDEAVVNGSMCRLNVSAGGIAAPAAIGLDPGWKPRLGPIVRRLTSRFGCGGSPRMANFSTFFDFYLAGVGFLKYGTRLDPSRVKAGKVADMRAMLALAGELAAAHAPAEAKRRFMRVMENWDGRKY